ncbi:MAG: DUF4834 family protein [Bacteroidota bacterium]
MVVLQTILFLIIVYYIAKILWKWLAPKLLNYAVQKTEERFGQQFGPFYEGQRPREHQSKTTVHKTRNPKSNPSKKVGEYIDFEEIE